MPDVRQEAQGPPSRIADDGAAKEIGKLWRRVQSFEDLASKDDIESLRKELYAAVANVKPATQQVGGVGLDIRSLNNRFTGQNIFAKAATQNSPSVRIESLNYLPFYPSIPSNLLDIGLVAAIDIRKTSESAEAKTGNVGGISAMVVQHRVGRTASSVGELVFSAVRMAIHSEQPEGTAIGLNLSVLTAGSNSAAQGINIDAYHIASGNVSTWGMMVNCLRKSWDGKVAGIVIRARGEAPYDRPISAGIAITASGNNSGSYDAAISIGTDYTGQSWSSKLNCQYGIDLALAQCSRAAIRIATDSLLCLDGSSGERGLSFNGSEYVFSGIGRQKVWAVDAGDGVMSMPVTPTYPPLQEKEAGTFAVYIQGIKCYVPYYTEFT